MKTILYYFSGTGNSLVAAKKIASQIEECTLVPIVYAMNNDQFIIEPSRIIFVFPLYFLSFPKIVLDFIDKVELKENVEIICITTRGFKAMGGVFSHFRKILKSKNRKLSMGFYIDMPSNDVTLFNIHSKEEQEELLDAVDDKIHKIVEVILNHKTHYDPEPFGFMRHFRYKQAYLNHLKTAYKLFYAEKSCSGCGICSFVCPINNIMIKDKKPIWKDNCQLCEACINFCPMKCIQFSNKSQKKERYVHPKVSMKDIAAQKSSNDIKVSKS